MKPKHEEGKKIPFFFTPIPNFLFESDYFRDAEYFRFLCYAFSRTTFERKIAVFNGQKLELNSLEFVFGRNKWAEYLEIDSTLVRKYISQLTRQQIAIKVASKCTSKLSVYKWTSSHFFNETSYQINQQTASKLPSKPPQIKNIKNIEEEQQQQKDLDGSQPSKTESIEGGAAAAFPKLVGKAKKLLFSLPDEKRNAIIALYHKRTKSQPIENAEAWFIKCIEGEWHAEEKLALPKAEPSDFEKNRELAKEIVQKFKGYPGLHICLRCDFLELGGINSYRWQIFYSEASKVFQHQIDAAIQKLVFGNLAEQTK